MKPDIREQTVIVIRKDGKYLSRREMLTGRIVWDPHLGSAWKTRNKAKAIKAAERYGGKLYLFNQIIWRVQEL